MFLILLTFVLWRVRANQAVGLGTCCRKPPRVTVRALRAEAAANNNSQNSNNKKLLRVAP